MTVPVFEEYEPALDCPCPGCAGRRRERARGLPVRHGGSGARLALALTAVLGLAWGGGATVAVASPGGPAADPGTGGTDAAVTATAQYEAADPDPSTPQGTSGPLHGGSNGDGTPTLRGTTRAEIINRAKKWVGAQVPYSMTKYWSDGYRQDCSGYVSMAWNLESNEWTGSLAEFGVKITREELQPGDMLLFHNPSDPNKGSHVTLFGGWTDPTHTYYLAYEQTPPHTRALSTPMAYWTNSSEYVPYRYKGLTETAAGPSSTKAPYPGAARFGPGSDNAYVRQLGDMLVARGGKRFYPTGTATRWSDSDRRATRAFQRAQGWTGTAADGIPGKGTWSLLVGGTGKDIPVADAGGSTAAPTRVPAYPGASYFRPGRTNPYVLRLGNQLVKKGFGRHYPPGPSSTWGESDRRNVVAFQKAQGWTGSSADGYPGPETWRRLFA